jgi:putative ABC transport system permease protein
MLPFLLKSDLRNIAGQLRFSLINRIGLEIGIRKVSGAKTVQKMAMLNKDFVKWVAIAFIIATPLAWIALNKWFENFAYKTSLSCWIFALAGVLAMGIALLTVSWQRWRAATRNPVEALKYE